MALMRMWLIAAVLIMWSYVLGIRGDDLDCIPKLTELEPCLPYVQGSGGRPDSSCCKVLKDVHTKSPICLCKLVSSQSDQASTPGVNLTLALQLPQACNMIVNPNKCPELERSRDPHLNPSTVTSSPGIRPSSSATGEHRLQAFILALSTGLAYLILVR